MRDGETSETTPTTNAAGKASLHPRVHEIWLFWIAQKANKNLEKWGVQDFETLGLAVCEEAGELAQAILQNRHEGGERGRITHEALDLAALCVQVLVTMAEKYGAKNVYKALRVTCAKCDRGDVQAWHAGGCPANVPPHTGAVAPSVQALVGNSVSEIR